jgi:predicted DNA-binding protein
MKYNESSSSSSNTSIRISAETRQLLSILAAVTGKSRDYLINAWLREELGKHGVDIKEYVEDWTK